MDPSQPFAIQFQPPPPPPPPHQPPYSVDVHPVSAANPTPTFSQPIAPSHPSYAEMITAAILWENSQGKQGGSSKRAIEKYIDRAYNNLPPTHSALLSHHLKRLKNSGQLVMLKNSYQLPSFLPPPSAAATLPAPFRSEPPEQFPPPPQPFPLQFQPSQYQPPAQYQQPPQFQPQPQSVASVQSATPKRKPGRPAKTTHSPAEQVVEPQHVSGSANGSVKRRGRPPKNQNQQQQVMLTTAEVPFSQPITQAQPISQVQPVQKPVYVIVDNGEQLSSGEKRGRGRPKKKPEAYPQPFEQESVQEKSVVAEIGPASAPRKRGRPKREVNNTSADASGGSSQEMAVARGVVGSSPRGRGTGRGRPRKNVVPGPVSALGPIPSANVGMKRRGWVKGRPRGKKSAAGEAVRVALGVKRRGRPPSGSGGMVRQKRVSRTGKTLGRPRKNASIVEEQASEQEQWLLKKLEDMQSKIRDAVGTIRPSLVNQNAPDAWTALQQLEDLSTMPLIEAPTETAPPVSVSTPPPSTSEPESVAPSSLAVPPEMMVTAPPTMNAPFPFNVTEQLHAPGFGDHQAMSWIPSSGAQS